MGIVPFKFFMIIIIIIIIIIPKLSLILAATVQAPDVGVTMDYDDKLQIEEMDFSSTEESELESDAEANSRLVHEPLQPPRRLLSTTGHSPDVNKSRRAV